MDVIQKAAIEIFESNKPIKEIVQNLSKSELDQLQEYIIGIGYKEVCETLYKGVNFAIGGVTHPGFIPEGHPEREIVAKYINKLLALPQDHPKKDVAVNLARALHEKHFSQPKGGVETATKPAPVKPDIVPIPTNEPPSVDYSSWNKPKVPEAPKTIIHYDTAEGSDPIVEHKSKGGWTVK